MPKCFFTPYKKYYLSLIDDVQSVSVLLKIVLLITIIYTFSLMMDIDSEVNKANDEKEIHYLNKEKSTYVEFPSEQNTSKKGNDSESLSTKKPKEADKHKNISSTFNRSICQRKYFRPPPPIKRKPIPAVPRMSNPSAKIILQERQVEIKDLESQVVYLQNQIKELKAENRTLLDVQNRQSKELKKYSGGITDIPALIRSHNAEIKAKESNANVIRKELSMCQNDLKSYKELNSRKDQELSKIKLALKNSEKNVQEMTIGNRKLNRENKKLEDETRNLIIENEELKTEAGKLQKIIQQLTNKISCLEDALSISVSHKKQLEDELNELQSKYDESHENEITFKKSLDVQKVMSATQTEKVEMAHVAVMTIENTKELNLPSSNKISVAVQASQDQISQWFSSMELKETEIIENDVDEEEYCYSAISKDQFTALDIYPDIICLKESTNINSKPSSQARKIGFHKPMCSTSSFSQEIPLGTSEVKKVNRDFSPFSASEMLKKPLRSVNNKKTIPLSSHLHSYNSSTFFNKEPLIKSNITMGSSLNMDISARKDEDHLGLYFKEAAFKKFPKKPINQIESLEYSTNGRQVIQNDIKTRIVDSSCDTLLKSSYSNKIRNDLLSNLTSKQSTMYSNG